MRQGFSELPWILFHFLGRFLGMFGKGRWRVCESSVMRSFGGMCFAVPVLFGIHVETHYHDSNEGCPPSGAAGWYSSSVPPSASFLLAFPPLSRSRPMLSWSLLAPSSIHSISL